MILRRKRTIILVITLILLVVAVIFGKKYFSFSGRIKTLSPSGEDSLVNQQVPGEQPPNSFFFGYETDPVTGNTDKLYKEMAHSGQYSAKAFGKESYSISVERTVAEIGPDKLTAISLSAWVYIMRGKDEPDAVFVFSATDQKGATICWKGITIKGNEIPRGKWFKVSTIYNLSDLRFPPGSKVQMYLWNRSDTKFLVDDLYVVFGTQKERKGDSAMVDMTRGKPFTPRFNYPPYQTIYFDKEEISKDNAPGLTIEKGKPGGEIESSDRVIAGRFIGKADDILLMKPSGKNELYTFCPEKSAFAAIHAEMPQEVLAECLTGEVMKGTFYGTGQEQLMVIGKNQLLLGTFEKPGDPCAGKEPATNFIVRSKTLLKDLSCPEGLNGVIIRPADLNGDRLTELLVIRNDGSWNVFSYSVRDKDNWTSIASGVNDIREWAGIITSGSVTAGKFIEKYPQDLVLSIYKDKATSRFCYSMQRFDPSTRKFVQYFPASQKFCGQTIGLDTLKPGDKFFFGIFSEGNETMILRYNRDWRFDLKQIKFSETTFEVLKTVDFQGYEKDHNPKYYEVLSIIPGMFRSPGITSLLVNARNRDGRKLPFLPNSTGIYTLMDPGKK